MHDKKNISSLSVPERDYPSCQRHVAEDAEENSTVEITTQIENESTVTEPPSNEPLVFEEEKDPSMPKETVSFALDCAGRW